MQEPGRKAEGGGGEGKSLDTNNPVMQICAADFEVEWDFEKSTKFCRTNGKKYVTI